MKLRHLFLLLLIPFLLIPPLPAETVDELRTRLLDDDLIEAAGDPVVAGAGVSVLTASGNRIVTEILLPVIVTTDSTGATLDSTKILLQVFDYNLVTEEAFVDSSSVRIRNYDPVADAPEPDSKELLYEGRQKLYDLRDAAVPMPAAASEELPLNIREPAWHGKIITKAKLLEGLHSVGGVQGVIGEITLSEIGVVSVFIWVNHERIYCVDEIEPRKKWWHR